VSETVGAIIPTSVAQVSQHRPYGSDRGGQCPSGVRSRDEAICFLLRINMKRGHLSSEISLLIWSLPFAGAPYVLNFSMPFRLARILYHQTISGSPCLRIMASIGSNDNNRNIERTKDANIQCLGTYSRSFHTMTTVVHVSDGTDAARRTPSPPLC